MTEPTSREARALLRFVDRAIDPTRMDALLFRAFVSRLRKPGVARRSPGRPRT